MVENYEDCAYQRSHISYDQILSSIQSDLMAVTSTVLVVMLCHLPFDVVPLSQEYFYNTSEHRPNQYHDVCYHQGLLRDRLRYQEHQM